MTTNITTKENKLLIMKLINQFLNQEITVDELVLLVNRYERKIAMKSLSAMTKSLWFRFPADSTLAETINGIASDLSLPDHHKNYKSAIERLELSKDGNFEIHFS